MFFLSYAATLVLIRPIAGKLSDRLGDASLIVPSLSVTALALVVLSFSAGLWGVIIAAVLYGVGVGFVQPSIQAVTIRMARPDRIGVANASLSTATDLGIGLGAVILGWVSQYTGYRVLFIVTAVSVTFSLALFTVFVKRAAAGDCGEPKKLDTT